MHVSRRSLLLGLSAGLTCSTFPVAWAAEDPAKFPSKPIKMVVPFAPGGASDFAARIIQDGMSKYLGQPVVVENKPGAAGNIGMGEAARAEPDGYTLFLGNVGTLSVNPALFPALKLQPEKDFASISLVAETPDVLITSKKFPPNTVKELIEYVKARPGKVNFASPGSGSLNRLEMEVFRKELGLDMQHIPFKGGAAPAVADVLAGHVETMFTTISSAISLIKAGELKVLAVTTRNRVPALPNVPTLAELGYPAMVSSSWQGLSVRAGTPKPIVDKLYKSVIHALSSEEVKKRMADGGVLAVTSKSPEEYAAFIAAESKRWAKVVEESGARAD